MKKLFALIIAASAALAPMHAYAGQAQVTNAAQVAREGEDNNNVCGNGILDILNCNDIDVNVVV
jgi:hypothetical protein